MKDVEILNLADYPQYIEEVSRWIYEEWSKPNGGTLENTIYRIRHSAKKGGVPQVHIALLGKELIGTFSLWNNDFAVLVCQVVKYQVQKFTGDIDLDLTADFEFG